MSAKQTPLVDLLRLHAEDLHSAHGHNRSSLLLSRAADEVDHLRAELAECISALKKIANPIDAMQRELPDGARLNGAMATALANDPNYLRDVAKTILQNHAARKGEEE